MLRTQHRSTLLLASLTALGLAACGGGSGNTGAKPRPDAGPTDPVDAGSNTNPTVDAGSATCSANPNGCAPNQLVGAAPACDCLPICAEGFVWNEASMRCDVAGGGGRDGGVNPGTDAGTPEPDGCESNADCTAPLNRCVSPSSGDDCARNGDCLCALGCTPFQASSTCPQGADCRWFGAANEGICIPADGGNTTNGASCTVQFDNQGNPQSDSCSGSRNFFCAGASPESPTGVCIAICNAQNDSLCSTLGNFSCNDIMNPQFPGIGLCLPPPPNHTDYGQSCMNDGMCQGGICSQVLAGSCSAPCEGITSCAAGGVCLDLSQFGEGIQCATECTPGTQGQQFCAGRNPATTCENIAPAGQAPVGVCIPRCTSNTDCGGGTCNTMTGLCG